MNRKSSSENMDLHKKRMQSIREKMNRKNLKKVIKDHALQHWSLKLALGVFVLGIVLFPIVKLLLLSLAFVMGAALCGGLGFWYNSTKNTDSVIHDYITEMQQLLVLESKRKQQLIMGQLKEFGSEKGSKQVEKFYGAFDNLKEALTKQFSEKELTYKRYAEAANEVLLSGIDNLQDVLIGLKSIKDIDHDYLKERIDKLNGSQDQFEVKEMKILEKRLKMYEDEVDRINNMLLENDKAVDQMKTTTLALNKVQNKEEESVMTKINESIEELRIMTNKLSKDA